MTLRDLNELAQRYSFDADELSVLIQKYPSAKKDFIEQVLSYVKKHGAGFSFAFSLMEMDKDLLSYYGLYQAPSAQEHTGGVNALK